MNSFLVLLFLNDVDEFRDADLVIVEEGQFFPDVVEFSMDAASGTGTYQLDEMVYQGYTAQTATATAKVVLWANDKLHLSNINGDFVSTQPIYGVNTRANYKFTSYNITPNKYLIIDTKPNPLTANATSPYTANTKITEYN